jgi:dipeptidyl aminopeptidase/acylaminoacyl peptidase
MTSKFSVAFAAFAFLVAASCTVFDEVAEGFGGMPNTSIIPRKDIFGNPTRTAARISPDGKMISFIAPKDGVLNVWVAPVDALDQAKAVTNSTDRPIRQYFWALTGTHIVYLNDVGGDENFLLYSVDVTTGEEKTLTPFEKTRVNIYNGSYRRPEELIIGLNNRNPSWHDVYIVNIRTGDLKRILRNTKQYDGFIADDDLNLRFATRTMSDGSQKVFKLTRGRAREFMTIAPDDVLTTNLIGMSDDGRTLYSLNAIDRDKVAFIAYDVDSKQPSVIAESDKADVDSFFLHPVTNKPLGFSVNYLKSEWQALDDSVRDDLAYLNTNVSGQYGIVSQDKANEHWVLYRDATTSPIDFVLYDRKSKSLTKLFTTRPNLEDAPLSPMYPVEIKARDGETLVSYLSLPRGTDSNGDGKPSVPLAMVLNVHGGPWARDEFGYNGEHQWLANRGYAVLSVNYRGSTGFGKSFVNKSNREWGGKMHDDLMDAVKWAVDSGIAQKDKIAIYGGSYGGYATLVGLTFTPTAFTCGVDIVGVSNLNTFMNTIPPYWDAFRPVFYQRVGDPTTEEGKAFLASRSPVTKVDEIQRPLLIAQGANDPRVNQAESDQIVDSMKKAKIPVTYVLYPDEGHGFAKPANRTSFYAISEAFLSQCLGGRYEPIGQDFEGANFKVLDGAQYVPGLEAAAPK